MFAGCGGPHPKGGGPATIRNRIVADGDRLKVAGLGIVADGYTVISAGRRAAAKSNRAIAAGIGAWPCRVDLQIRIGRSCDHLRNFIIQLPHRGGVCVIDPVGEIGQAPRQRFVCAGCEGIIRAAKRDRICLIRNRVRPKRDAFRSDRFRVCTDCNGISR